MPRLVSRSDLARLAGVSPAAVTKACKHQLAPACEGKRIDLDHPATVIYFANKGGKVPEPEPPAPPPPPIAPHAKHGVRAQRSPEASRPLTSVDQIDPQELEALEELSLRELTERYGTVAAFKDWLDARKKIADIREKDLKNDEAEGRLVSRELVEHHVFGAIENANRQLLGDAPKTIARRLYAMAKSGHAIEEAERVVRDVISSQLRPVKGTAARVLRNA